MLNNSTAVLKSDRTSESRRHVNAHVEFRYTCTGYIHLIYAPA